MKELRSDPVTRPRGPPAPSRRRSFYWVRIASGAQGFPRRTRNLYAEPIWIVHIKGLVPPAGRELPHFLSDRTYFF